MTADESGALTHQPFQEGRHYTVDETGCWNWTGHTLRGYANSSSGRPHRRMYAALVGPVPATHDLHHRCHNRLCINPAHLEPVERRVHRRHHRREDSALTADLVVELREEAFAGEKLNVLAKRYGISTSAVDAIVWGEHWPEVGGPLGRPPAFCSFCGAELEGMRHKRYCDKTCRRRAQTARERAERERYWMAPSERKRRPTT